MEPGGSAFALSFDFPSQMRSAYLCLSLPAFFPPASVLGRLLASAHAMGRYNWGGRPPPRVVPIKLFPSPLSSIDFTVDSVFVKLSSRHGRDRGGFVVPSVRARRLLFCIAFIAAAYGNLFFPFPFLTSSQR